VIADEVKVTPKHRRAPSFGYLVSDGTAKGTAIVDEDGTRLLDHLPVVSIEWKIAPRGGIGTGHAIRATIELEYLPARVVAPLSYTMRFGNERKVLKRIEFEDGTVWEPEIT
jgi:hypothetical protein